MVIDERVTVCRGKDRGMTVGLVGFDQFERTAAKTTSFTEDPIYILQISIL